MLSKATDQQKRPLSPSDHIPVREHSVLKQADVLYMGERERIQVWGWALFMGDKKSKPWEISSQVSYLDQHILVHLGQITSTSSLFRARKKYSFFFFLRNAQLTPACFLSSERRCCGGCIKELDISLSSSSSGTGYS